MRHGTTQNWWTTQITFRRLQEATTNQQIFDIFFFVLFVRWLRTPIVMFVLSISQSVNDDEKKKNRIKSNRRRTTTTTKNCFSGFNEYTRSWFIICDFSNVGYERFRGILNSIVPQRRTMTNNDFFSTFQHSLPNFLFGAFVSFYTKFDTTVFVVTVAVTVVALTAPNQLITTPIRYFSSLSCSTPSSILWTYPWPMQREIMTFNAKCA